MPVGFAQSGAKQKNPRAQELLQPRRNVASFCSRGPLRGTEESSRVSGPCPLLPCRHLSELGNGDTVIIHGLTAHSRHWKMNYVSFISKKQSQSPFVIKFAVRETLLYLITSDISWLLVLETIKV